MGDLGSWSNVFNMDPGALGTITLATGVTAMVGSFACGAGGASADIQRFARSQVEHGLFHLLHSELHILSLW